MKDNALLLPVRRRISHHKRRLFQFWRGRYGSEPPSVRFLSFSCSFQRKPCQIIGYFPKIQELAHPLLGILICHCKIYFLSSVSMNAIVYLLLHLKIRFSCAEYRSGTVNSKFHLIRSFCEIFARFLSFHV